MLRRRRTATWSYQPENTLLRSGMTSTPVRGVPSWRLTSPMEGGGRDEGREGERARGRDEWREGERGIKGGREGRGGRDERREGGREG